MLRTPNDNDTHLVLVKYNGFLEPTNMETGFSLTRREKVSSSINLLRKLEVSNSHRGDRLTSVQL